MKIARVLFLFFFACGAMAADIRAPLEKVHFLIPAGPGGGWDGTARGMGEVMIKSGLVDDVSFENLSGGGGGKAPIAAPNTPWAIGKGGGKGKGKGKGKPDSMKTHEPKTKRTRSEAESSAAAEAEEEEDEDEDGEEEYEDEEQEK